SLFRYSNSRNLDSYDGGLGYAFIIASWRPMHFERFSATGDWDSFQLADPNYMNDPRPAVYELASLLAGENREAYTVKFARYDASTNGMGYYNAYSSLADFNYGYCAGYEPFGYASSPFDTYGVRTAGAVWGESFYYRGRPYYYDAGGDCYRQ